MESNAFVQLADAGNLERRAQAAVEKDAIAHLHDRMMCANPPAVLSLGPECVTVLDEAEGVFVHPFRALRVIGGRDLRVTMTGMSGQELQVVLVGLLAPLLRVA